jgi:cell division protein FtsL
MKPDQRQQGRRKQAVIWVAVMAVFMAELLFYTWTRVQCTRVGYEISRVRDAGSRQATLRNNLKIELARLKSPKRVEDIAKSRLGLTVPTPDQIIVIP